MPNRTIYVSDADLETFRRAQELAGDNLSAAISAAVKRYVEVQSASKAGFDEVVLKVGIGAGRKVRFSGVLLGEWVNSDNETTGTGAFEHYRVYRGSRGKFAVHVERSEYFDMRDAEGNPLTGWRAWTGIGMVSGGNRPAVGNLDVFDKLEEIREHVPPELYEMVATSVKQPFVEELDI